MKNSGSVQAHMACTRFISEGKGSPSQSSSDPALQTHWYIVLPWFFLAAISAPALRHKNPFDPNTWPEVVSQGLVHWTPQKHQERLSLYGQGWNQEPVLKRSLTLLAWFCIILMPNLQLVRVQCCSLGLRHFVSAVQDTQRKELTADPPPPSKTPLFKMEQCRGNDLHRESLPGADVQFMTKAALLWALSAQQNLAKKTWILRVIWSPNKGSGSFCH